MDDLSLVRDHTVLSVVAGSRAYGLATEDSDIDRRGVFVTPTPLFWGFAKPPSHVDGPDAATRLETERDRSSLPERPSAGPALHDLVVRARLADLPYVNSRSQG